MEEMDGEHHKTSTNMSIFCGQTSQKQQEKNNWIMDFLKPYKDYILTNLLYM